MDTISTDIQYSLPSFDAKTILKAITSQTVEAIDMFGLTFAYSNIFIQKLGGHVFAEVQIDAQTLEVKYMVECNIDPQAEYQLTDFQTAAHKLSSYLSSQVVF